MAIMTSKVLLLNVLVVVVSSSLLCVVVEGFHTTLSTTIRGNNNGWIQMIGRRRTTTTSTTTGRIQHRNVLYMSDGNEPSDVSDSSMYDNVVNVESEPYEPTETESLVSNVLDLMPSSSLSDTDESTRAAINEAIYKLEALNPTPTPTTSPLLNGVWQLRYYGGYAPDWALPSPTRQLALFLYSGGYSPGIFALGLAQKLPKMLVDVGDLEISISRDQPRVEAKVDVSVLGRGSSSDSASSVIVKASLTVESDVRLREKYTSATVLDKEVSIPEQVQYERELYITYLDDDLFIVRDGSGIPEVLVRKEKTFSQQWGTEPSEVDDMVPPGEESSE